MNNNWQFNLGILLIILSTVLYALLLVIPFLEVPVSAKLGITSAIVVVGEITFWIGGILVGKELIVKYKKYLNPLNWIKKNRSADQKRNNTPQ